MAQIPLLTGLQRIQTCFTLAPEPRYSCGGRQILLLSWSPQLTQEVLYWESRWIRIALRPRTLSALIVVLRPPTLGQAGRTLRVTSLKGPAACGPSPTVLRTRQVP